MPLIRIIYLVLISDSLPCVLDVEFEFEKRSDIEFEEHKRTDIELGKISTELVLLSFLANN